MARVIIDDNGTKKYLAPDGGWHRTDGPAFINKNGVKQYCIDDCLLLIVDPNGHLSRRTPFRVQEDNEAYKWLHMYPNGFKQFQCGGILFWPEL